jgi:hypothetical protein
MTPARARVGLDLGGGGSGVWRGRGGGDGRVRLMLVWRRGGGSGDGRVGVALVRRRGSGSLGEGAWGRGEAGEVAEPGEEADERARDALDLHASGEEESLPCSAVLLSQMGLARQNTARGLGLGLCARARTRVCVCRYPGGGEVRCGECGADGSEVLGGHGGRVRVEGREALQEGIDVDQQRPGGGVGCGEETQDRRGGVILCRHFFRSALEGQARARLARWRGRAAGSLP